MTKSTDRMIYVLVDGENIDRTLGQIHNKKPDPHQRPRWDRIIDYVKAHYKSDNCRALFFLNAGDGVPGSFIQALKTMEYVPIPLTSRNPDVKVVDEGILKTLKALNEIPVKSRFPAVVLVSHDSDFVPDFSRLSRRNKRNLGIIGFTEYFSGEYEDIKELEIWDLENDIGAFVKENGPLPRIRPIPLEEFDPTRYLAF